MEPWRTAIVNKDETHIWLRGYDITQLMSRASFASVLFLLHKSRLPTAGEERLFNALLIASADHGSGAPSCATARLAASGNRESLSAAVAAGVLAIGDVHGGAGALTMDAIAAITSEVKTAGGTVADAAARFTERVQASGQRVPGFGHRVHTIDPRVSVLFDMAKDAGVAGAGIETVLALDAALNRGKSGAKLPINIDGALAAILYDLGFPPSAGKLIFIAGRVAGLTAEVAEEHEREKPMRVRIPLDYDGPPPRDF
jgi:citrate synthase